MIDLAQKQLKARVKVEEIQKVSCEYYLNWATAITQQLIFMQVIKQIALLGQIAQWIQHDIVDWYPILANFLDEFEKAQLNLNIRKIHFKSMINLKNNFKTVWQMVKGLAQNYL